MAEEMRRVSRLTAPSPIFARRKRRIVDKMGVRTEVWIEIAAGEKGKNIGEIAGAYEEMQTRIGLFPDGGKQGNY